MIEINEIDIMYINFAIRHDGSAVDDNTARAVNESIDKFICMMEESIEWVDNDSGVEFICKDSLM